MFSKENDGKIGLTKTIANCCAIVRYRAIPVRLWGIAIVDLTTHGFLQKGTFSAESNLTYLDLTNAPPTGHPDAE